MCRCVVYLHPEMSDFNRRCLMGEGNSFTLCLVTLVKLSQEASCYIKTLVSVFAYTQRHRPCLDLTLFTELTLSKQAQSDCMEAQCPCSDTDCWLFTYWMFTVILWIRTLTPCKRRSIGWKPTRHFKWHCKLKIWLMFKDINLIRRQQIKQHITALYVALH